MGRVVHRVAGVPLDDPATATVQSLAPGVIDRFNTVYPDTVLLLGCALCGCPSATGAKLAGVDPFGLVLEITQTHGTRTARIDFPRPVEHPIDLSSNVCELVQTARTWTGGDAETSFERAMADVATRWAHPAGATGF